MPTSAIAQLGISTDLSALEHSLARSLPKNYSPRIIEATPPLSRSVTRASSRASPLRKAWRQAQVARPQSAEEIEVLAQLADAVKRLRSHDSVGLAESVPLGTTRRTSASVDLGREMDLLEGVSKTVRASRIPHSEALLGLMADLLVLTLQHAWSRAGPHGADDSALCGALARNSVGMQTNAADHLCVQSPRFGDLGRCLRLCAEAATMPAHRQPLRRQGHLVITPLAVPRLAPCASSGRAWRL